MASTSVINPIRKLLVVMPSWVGDCVMATPLLHALRHNSTILKHARFVGYMRPGLNDLLAGPDAALDEYITGRPRGLTGPWREAKRLRELDCDAVLLLPNSWRLAWTSRLARIPQRIGYGRDGRSWLLTHAAKCPKPGGWRDPISAVDYYLHLAGAFGVEGAQPNLPRLSCTPEQLDEGRKILSDAGIDSAKVRVALLNPGSQVEEKRWPADRFARLARHLSEHHDLRIVINGSPAEQELVASICRDAACGAVDLAEAGTTLGSLKAICAMSEIVVTNDTGTRHIAVGMAGGQQTDSDPGRPAILTLFGPVHPLWSTVQHPRQAELVGDEGQVDRIEFEDVATACDRLLGHQTSQ